MRVVYTQIQLLNLANYNNTVASGELSKNGKVQGKSSVLRKDPPSASELAKCQVSHSRKGWSLYHLNMCNWKQQWLLMNEHLWYRHIVLHVEILIFQISQRFMEHIFWQLRPWALLVHPEKDLACLCNVTPFKQHFMDLMHRVWEWECRSPFPYLHLFSRWIVVIGCPLLFVPDRRYPDFWGASWSPGSYSISEVVSWKAAAYPC